MSDPQGPTAAGNETCVPLIDHNLVLHISLAPAACIIIILSLLHGRRTSNKYCVWRPGAVVPLNFLDGYMNRWSLAATFGAISTRIPQLLFASAFYENTVIMLAPSLVQKTLFVVLAVSECTLAFFPLFACILSPFRLVASIFGLLYSIFWLVVQLIYVFSCPSNPDDRSLADVEMDYSKLIIQWPFCLLFAFLCLSFACKLWEAIRSRTYRWEKPEPIAVSHHKQHVRYLFMKPSDRPQIPKGTEYEGLIDTFRYTRYPGFGYPSRMLCILMITLTLAYQIFVEVLVYAIQATDQVAELLPTIIVDEAYSEIIKTSIVILTACIWITWAFLFVLLLTNLFLIFKNYRSHFLQLCRGDKTFASRAVAYCTSPELVVCSMRYAGYQIAYFISGYFVFAFAVLITLLVVIEGAYVFFTWFGWDGLLMIVEYAIVPLVFNLLLYYFQLFGSRLFLQKRPSPEQPIPLALRNLKSLETVNFVTFFYNITIGLMSSVKRILQTMVLGLIIICRVDRSPFNRSFERFDRGLKAYIGMLYVDYTQNHPVLRVFCSIMCKEKDESALHSIISTLHKVTAEQVAAREKKMNSPAKRRWRLAYTLIRNPQLILERKHQIALAAKEKGIPFASVEVDEQPTSKDNGSELPLKKMPSDFLESTSM